jgi:hypothetical protein
MRASDRTYSTSAQKDHKGRPRQCFATLAGSEIEAILIKWRRAFLKSLT